MASGLACRRFLAALAVLLCTAGCSDPPLEPGQQIEQAVDAYRRGDTDNALLLAEEGGRRSGDDAYWRARFELLRAEFFLARAGNQEEIDEANRLIAGAYETASGDGALLARWKYVRGYALYRERKYAEACEALDASVRIALEHSMPDVAIAALLVRGKASDRMLEAEESERHWTRALQIAEESRDGFQSAAARMNLGYAQMNQQRYDEAITNFEQAVTLAREQGADLLLSAAVGNLSQCWREVGDLERALDAGLEALEVTRPAGISSYLCNHLGTLGQIYRATGDSASAIDNLRQAVDLAEGPQAATVKALWSLELARALIAAGSTTESESWIEAARTEYAGIDKFEGLAEVDLAEASLAAARGDHERVIVLCEKVVAAFPEKPELQWRALAGLARSFHGTGRLGIARTHYTSALKEIRADRERLVRLESRVGFLTHSIGIYQDYVALLLEQGLDDEALRAIESSRAQTLLDDFSGLRTDDLALVNLKEVARRARASLLSYWISPRGSFVWVIGSQGARRIDLPDGNRIGDLVHGHKSVLEQGWRDPLTSGHPAGRELYRLLVEPVRDLVPPGSRVVVVPDGPLHLLNFETLVVEEERPHYLIEDWTVSVAPALALLVTEPARTAGREPSILLVGDPVETDPDFPALPRAGEELDSIATILSGATIDQLRGTEATPAAVLGRLAENYSWLHFAAHAQAGRGNPLDSSVVLSPGPRGFKLYARDIVERGIGADLVTLSACRGAGTRLFSGEGLVGFSWAFMRAGSSRVIAGLWDVSDRSTVLLMEGLYERLARGEDPDRALREAKLRLLHSDSNLSKPFYWGPFQLYTRTAVTR